MGGAALDRTVLSSGFTVFPFFLRCLPNLFLDHSFHLMKNGGALFCPTWTGNIEVLLFEPVPLLFFA